MHIVYRHRNTVNNKSYIGFTPKTAPVLEKPFDEMLEEEKQLKALELMQIRLNCHLIDVKKGSQLFFHRAIRKYGIEAFEHLILEICRTKEEACDKEIEWIARLETFGKGYNMTPGGEGVIELSEEQKTKRKESLRKTHATLDYKSRQRERNKNPEFKEKHRAATKAGINKPGVRQRIGASARATWANPENYERLRQSKVGERNGRAKLTVENVKELRDAWKLVIDPDVKGHKKEFCKRYAQTFNVTGESIYGVIMNKTWKHLL